MTVSSQIPFNEYAGNGSAKTFTYTFYITTNADLRVYINGVIQSSGFTISGAGNSGGGSVTFTSAPPSGSTVTLRRFVALERTTDYQESSAIPTDTLDRDFDRLWMATQDGRVGTISLDDNRNFDALSNRIINVADPVNDQDAATKHWVLTALDTPVGIATTKASEAANSAAEALASKNAAGVSEANAAASASTASTYKDHAFASETNAATSATAAANSAIAAANSAASIFGAVEDAEEAASAASVSASTAETYKNDAAGSAIDAAASAVAALGHRNAASLSEANAEQSAADAEASAQEAHDILEQIENATLGDVVNTVNGRNGTVILDKTDVGLANVDNTSDLNKPISTATQTALNGKADADDLPTWSTIDGKPEVVAAGATGNAALSAIGFPGTNQVVFTRSPAGALQGITYSSGTLNNSLALRTASGQVAAADAANANEAVTLGQLNTALGSKADVSSLGDLASINLIDDPSKVLAGDGTWITPSGGGGGSSSWGSITGTLSDQLDLNAALAAKAPLANPSFTGTVSGVTKSMVGLGNVDNTSDANKPISTATQTALNGKLSTSGTKSVTGDTTFAGAITATGAVLINSTLTVNSTLSVSSKATVGGVVSNGQAYTTPVSLSYASSLAVNVASTNVVYVGALTGNVTSLSMTGGQNGQTVNIRFVQDGTGGRTVTLPSTIKAAGSIESGANRASWLIITYVGIASRWEGAWTSVPA